MDAPNRATPGPRPVSWIVDVLQRPLWWWRAALALSGRKRVQLIFFLCVIGIFACFEKGENVTQKTRMVLLTLVGAQPMPVRYADCRYLITALQLSRAGIDIRHSCRACAVATGISGDLPFNYPRTVEWLGRAIPKGWTANDAEWIGPLIDITFLLAAATLLCSSHWRQNAFSAAILVSPPVLLGLERANYDLIIFSLVWLNLWLIDRWWNGAAFANAFALGLLKFYPIVTILGLVRKTNASVRWLLAILAGEAAFICLSLRQIRDVAQNTEQLAYPSYGYPIAFLSLQTRLNPGRLSGTPQGSSSIALPFLVFFGGLVMYFALRNREFLIAFLSCGTQPQRSAFLAGSAVFSVSFASGLNFNYRLIFLLLTVPYLFAVLRNGPKTAGAIARMILGVLFVVLWLPLFFWRPAGIFYFSESASTWLLFGLLTSCCLIALYDLLQSSSRFESRGLLT